MKEINGWEVVEGQGDWKLFHHGKLFKTSNSGLDMEMELIERILPYGGWDIYERLIVDKDAWIYTVTKDMVAVFGTLDYPDACLYIINALEGK